MIATYESYGLSSVAAWRLSAPMTRKVLSLLSEVPVDAIGEIERAERVPSSRELAALSAVLGARPEDLAARARVCEG
ncbi:helix-turn-helix domain-containing protein [Frigidibacter sp. MR17.24]|uniref:helix-turn-helix domain-containing protein n=1 Tax=Frigidibacter sp. MR17.24 TaxID=3127345 RepID=UPI003012E889